MRFQLLAAIAALFLGAVAPPAQADDASRLALAHEVVGFMDVQHVVDEMFQQLSPMIAGQAGQEMHLSASEQARLGEILGEEFHNALPQMLDSVANVYSRNISEDQLRQIRDFLQSPAGHAMIASQGSMQQELQREGETIGMQVAGRAMQRFSAERQAGAIH